MAYADICLENKGILEGNNMPQLKANTCQYAYICNLNNCKYNIEIWVQVNLRRNGTSNYKIVLHYCSN